MNYNNLIALALKKEYDFNDYEISKEKLIEVSNIVERIFNKDMVLFGKFIDDLHCGKLGMWYKQPVSILSIANKYQSDNTKSKPTLKQIGTK